MRLSAAYKGMNALLMKEGAQDLRSGQKFDHTVFFGENVDIHHIFPKVPHTLYRHIKHDFAKLCADNDVLYVNQPIGKALRDHLKWLKKMGAEPTTTP